MEDARELARDLPRHLLGLHGMSLHVDVAERATRSLQSVAATWEHIPHAGPSPFLELSRVTPPAGCGAEAVVTCFKPFRLRGGHEKQRRCRL
jgi:hypothetical protein